MWEWPDKRHGFGGSGLIRGIALMGVALIEGNCCSCVFENISNLVRSKIAPRNKQNFVLV